MKKFIITLLLSGLIIGGVWIVPEMGSTKSKGITMTEKELREIYEGNIQLDTVPIPQGEGEIRPAVPIMEAQTVPMMPMLKSEPNTGMNWQGFITWIIGSLNGLFGMVLLVKKVFTKS